MAKGKVKNPKKLDAEAVAREKFRTLQDFWRLQSELGATAAAEKAAELCRQRCPHLKATRATIYRWQSRHALHGLAGLRDGRSPVAAVTPVGQPAGPGWISIAEASRRSGVSPRTLRHRCRKWWGQGLAARRNGEWLVNPAADEAFTAPKPLPAQAQPVQQTLVNAELAAQVDAVLDGVLELRRLVRGGG